MIQTILDRFRAHKLEKYFLPTLLVAVLGSMLISLMIGLGQSVWFDEAYSVLLAKQPMLNLIHLTTHDANPPLYYVLLKGWGSVLGWSELSLRSLSVICMGGAIYLAGLLTKRMFGVRVALVALPFIALSPLVLRYGFEIGMYSLAMFIGVAATYTLVLALETKARARRWRLYVLYTLLVALGLYAYYALLLLWLVHFVWLVGKLLREKRSLRDAPWLLALLGAAVLFIPWAPVAVMQIAANVTPIGLQSVTIENLASVISFAFLYEPSARLDGAGTIIMLFIIVTLGVLIARAFRVASKKERDYLTLLAMYVPVPIGIVALASLVWPLYSGQMVACLIIGGMMIVGVVVAYGLRKMTRQLGLATVVVYIGLVLGVGQLALVGNYDYYLQRTPAAKRAAAVIRACGSNKTILAADPYVAIELSYYKPSCEIRFYSDADNLTGKYAILSQSSLRIAHPASQLANSTQLYYVYYNKARLDMPANMIQVSHDEYDTLNVDTFVME